MGSLRRFAFTWLVCVGCGSVNSSSGHLADAPPGGDDAPAAPTRGTVTVTVLDASGSGVPAVGASVVFIDPDGTMVKRVATDTSGKASADVLPGASVTAIATVSPSYELITVQAIKPGDDLVIGTRNEDDTEAASFTVTYPAFANATQYQIAAPCGTVTVASPAGAAPVTSAPVTIQNSCKTDPMEIVVMPLDGNNRPLGALGVTTAFVSSGTVALSGTYGAARTFTASYSNIDPGITSLTMSRTVPDGNGLGASQSAQPPTASQVLAVTGASGSNARIVSQFVHGTSQQQILQDLAGTATTYGVDVGNNLLPWIDAMTFDPVAQKLNIQLDTTGTSSDPPDVVVAALQYVRTDAAMQSSTTFTWVVLGPDPGKIVLPALPAEVGDVMPRTTDTVGRLLTELLEVDTITSYDMIRPDILVLRTSFEGPRSAAHLVRYSRWTSGAR